MWYVHARIRTPVCVRACVLIQSVMSVYVYFYYIHVYCSCMHSFECVYACAHAYVLALVYLPIFAYGMRQVCVCKHSLHMHVLSVCVHARGYNNVLMHAQILSLRTESQNMYK